MITVTIMKKQKNKKTRVGIFENMDVNIPVGNFLAGNFYGGNSPGGSLIGGNFQGGGISKTCALLSMSFGDFS